MRVILLQVARLVGLRGRLVWQKTGWDATTDSPIGSGRPPIESLSHAPFQYPLWDLISEKRCMVVNPEKWILFELYHEWHVWCLPYVSFTADKLPRVECNVVIEDLSTSLHLYAERTDAWRGKCLRCWHTLIFGVERGQSIMHAICTPGGIRVESPTLPCYSTDGLWKGSILTGSLCAITEHQWDFVYAAWTLATLLFHFIKLTFYSQ